MPKSKVYYIKEITPDNLIKIYKALGVDLKSKGKVGVKISSVEGGNKNGMKATLLKPLVESVNGTLIECNTAYPGTRNETKAHWKTIEEHGYKIMPFDLMDEEGEMEIPVEGGFHLKQNIVGKHLSNYKAVIILSHFKGHQMGGFGGALKNISIGMASSRGKTRIHTANATSDVNELWGKLAKQDDFLESMADACKGIISFIGKNNMVYINVCTNVSIDCDCDKNAKPPCMADFGIYASTDPVAVDQATVDHVYNSKDTGKKPLIERIEKQHGIHTVESAEKLGLGSRKYEIVNL